MGLNGFDQFMGNGYFRTIWTVAYQFWAHLISVPQLGRLFFFFFFFGGGGGAGESKQIFEVNTFLF